MAPQETGRKCLLLPEGTIPSPDDILIGRGRRFVQHNTKFYKIIESEIQAYECSAQNKTMKSIIILRVLTHIKEEVGGRFLKKDKTTSRWMVAEDTLARTTIAQAFRDRLNKSYRSSKQSKQRRRAVAKYMPSSSSSSISSPISVVTSAKAIAITAATRDPVPVESTTKGSGDISCSKLVAESNIAVHPPATTRLSNDRTIQNLRASIQEVLDMTDDVMDFGDGPTESGTMDSLDGASLVLGAFAGGDPNCIMSSSLFNDDNDDDAEDFMMSSSFLDLFLDQTNFEGNPFEPIPLREPGTACN